MRLNNQDKTTYIENALHTYHAEHGTSDDTPEFLALQATIWKTGGRRPGDRTVLDALNHIQDIQNLDGMTLYDDEELDDVDPGEPRYQHVLADHEASIEQQLTAEIWQMIEKE